nr:hypothetical protein [Galactobacillus timonensis]
MINNLPERVLTHIGYRRKLLILAELLRVDEIHAPSFQFVLGKAGIHINQLIDADHIRLAFNFQSCLFIQIRTIGKPEEPGCRIRFVGCIAKQNLLKQGCHDYCFTRTCRCGERNNLRCLSYRPRSMSHINLRAEVINCTELKIK